MKNFCYAALAMGMGLASPAFAGTLTFTLNQNGCTGGCGTPPYGTILVEQDGTNLVKVTETLASGVKFVDTGAGEALEFSVSGNPSIVIDNLTTGFSVGPAPATASTFGKFNYSIDCSSCGSGGSDPNPGPLSFTVGATGITPQSFVSSTKDGVPTVYFFASDIIDNKTGNVAALAGSLTPPTNTPEPASIALLGVGMIGIAGMRRKTA